MTSTFVVSVILVVAGGLIGAGLAILIGAIVGLLILDDPER
jgi:hypothetical protein